MEEQKENQTKVDTQKIEKVEIEKNDTVLGSCLSMDIIRKYYHNENTSGTMNKPKLVQGCYLKQDLYYGFYDLIDRKSELKPPIVAKAIVSFEKIPWNEDDDNQEILILIVKDKLFKCDPASFSVGDNVRQIDSSFSKQTSIENISYYQKGNCMVAVKLQGEIISKYIVWICNLSKVEISGIHSIVEGYLK